MAVRVDPGASPNLVTPTDVAQSKPSSSATGPDTTPVDRRAQMQSPAPQYAQAVGADGALAPAQAGGASRPYAWAPDIRKIVLGLARNPDAAKLINAACSAGLA